MKKTMMRFMMIVGVAAMLTVLGGCSGKQKSAATGAVVGTVAGAGIGGLAGGGDGALIGGLIGSLSGGILGHATHKDAPAKAE